MATTTGIKGLAGQIKAEFPAHKALREFRYRLDAAVNGATEGRLPYPVYTAAYGLAWTLQTGRVAGGVDRGIKALDARKLAELLATLAVECPTIGDVPRWINARADRWTA